MRDNTIEQYGLDELEELAEKDESELSDSEITSMVKLSVKRRFDAPEWVIVFEIAGPNNRRADAIAVNTFPARNHKIVGFEFKASRSDWKQELRDGEKANHFVQLCDEWYVVAGRRGIVEEEELPAGWGLFELKPNSGQLWKLEESELTDYQSGEPDRQFWAKFLQKTVGRQSNFTTADIKEAKRRGYEEAKDKAVDQHMDYSQQKLKDKADMIDQLNDAGLKFYRDIDEDEIERLKRAKKLLKKIEADEYHTIPGRLESFEDTVERKYENIQDEIDEVRAHFESIKDDFEDDP